MKYLTTIALIFIVSVSYGQTHLADTTKIKLSAKDVIAISAKVDSLEMLLTNTSHLPSDAISAFNARVNLAFAILWKQVQAQLVVDKPKTTTK